ncbi:hypothetical protein [Pedobacter arcticus]|uniref:hypothetical protein n=1 Tax=Pedobacter arcticus TaxID=752140 RepID=UPI0012B51578|nr:hypothetical protein [Pedobacter arcticus]
MDINISEANQFINLHAHPQDVTSKDLSLINDWISEYPYSQSLKFLVAQATKQSVEAGDNLIKAATFASNREVLFQFVNHVETFNSDPVVLDENLNNQNEVLETVEPRNDMGQAFGSDLNYYKVNESNSPVTTEQETPTEESVLETESVEETVSEENAEEIAVEQEETPTEEPIQETESVEEIVSEENTEEIAVAEEETPTEESIQETESVEEVVSEENENGEEIAVAEEETPTEEPVLETESVEETVSEENTEEIAVAEEEIATEEPVLETESIEEIVSEENAEEIAVEQEETPTEESIQETESVEEVVSEENTEEIAAAEEEIATEEPVIETESIEEIVSEENAEEIAVEQEETPTEESIQETESVEEVVSEENTEEIAVAEEETPTEEPIKETESVEETVSEENENGEEIAIADYNKEEESIPEPSATKLTEKDELIFDSPVASDFFAFAKAEKPASPAQPIAEPQKVIAQEKPKEDIAQYNDERLPYTFLWWLNKTRKEHANNNQPYVKVATQPQTKIAGQSEPSLNHQIAENIFHLRGVDEISTNNAQNQTVPFDFRKKEFYIVEKFIKEEPQIKPPAANKIDTENKAKKSSEDANQVVSETLAKIYVEQMLYHKALDVYKKLSLKYPEKSTYFASQIKYLELKVN